MEDKVFARKEAGLWWLVFNRPEKRNAISPEMAGRAVEIIEAFASDETARVLIVTGAGEQVFVSGADISQLPGAKDDGPEARTYKTMSPRLMTVLAETPKPTIAMIHGYCFGAGVALAASCDLRFCSEDAQFSIPAAKLGVVYPLELMGPLIDLVGPARTKEFMYTARRVNAREAAAMGLVNNVLPKPELEQEVRRIALTIAENAPLTHTASKTIICEYLKGAACDTGKCEEAVQRCVNSEDFRNATRAFMEKRKPVFKGR